MDLMCSRNSHMISMDTEKRALLLELQRLDNRQKGEPHIDVLRLRKADLLFTALYLPTLSSCPKTLKKCGWTYGAPRRLFSAVASYSSVLSSFRCILSLKQIVSFPSCVLPRWLNLEPRCWIVEYKLCQFLAPWLSWKKGNWWLISLKFVIKGLYSYTVYHMCSTLVYSVLTFYSVQMLSTKD